MIRALKHCNILIVSVKMYDCLEGISVLHFHNLTCWVLGMHTYICKCRETLVLPFIHYSRPEYNEAD